jgi:hypothetical protein
VKGAIARGSYILPTDNPLRAPAKSNGEPMTIQQTIQSVQILTRNAIPRDATRDDVGHPPLLPTHLSALPPRLVSPAHLCTIQEGGMLSSLGEEGSDESSLADRNLPRRLFRQSPQVRRARRKRK